MEETARAAERARGEILGMPVLSISFSLADMVAVGSSVQIAIHLGEKKELGPAGFLPSVPC